MTQSTEPPRRADHPPELVALDRPYLLEWGRRDMVIVAIRVALLAAVVAGVAWLTRLPYVLLLEAPLVFVLASSVLFFRNPRRRVPTRPGILVAPADGRVSDIEELVESEYIGGPALRIGIFLSIFSVHVNRAPDSGEVEYTRYRVGKFHDARDPRCITENESQTIGMSLDGTRVLVRQISGAIARRILCPLVVGQQLARGGLIGMIKYGSRTELWVPADAGWRVTVKVGDGVTGGETVLLERDTG